MAITLSNLNRFSKKYWKICVVLLFFSVVYWLLTENYVLNASVLIHTELFSNVSGLGLENFFGPRPRPRPHSFWPRPRPWPHAQLASLTSLLWSTAYIVCLLLFTRRSHAEAACRCVFVGSDVLVLTTAELPANRRRIRLKLKSSSILVLPYDVDDDVIQCPAPAAWVAPPSGRGVIHDWHDVIERL